MPSANEAVIAAAGSGKTERLIEEALADADARVLVTTYTRENLSEIDARLWKASGTRTHKVTVMSWFEFLLRDAIKPYQGYKTEILSLRSINFETQPPRYARESSFQQYYIDSASNVYRDRVSALACKLDDLSDGRVVSRLVSCFGLILIDEIQDFAGYDLELLERLLRSRTRILAVGDPRQAVYLTNNSAKNSGMRRANIINWIEAQKKAGVLNISHLTESFRCNQQICDYADALYPDMPGTTSKNTTIVRDMGIHLVHVDDLDSYRQAHNAAELRWDKRNKLALPSAMNFGEVKGKTFDRVLIFPTKTITAYIESGDDLVQGARAKLYVAVTRARHSVGIVTTTKKTNSGLSYWTP